jgi:hypothetical protein
MKLVSLYVFPYITQHNFKQIKYTVFLIYQRLIKKTRLFLQNMLPANRNDYLFDTLDSVWIKYVALI